MKEDDYEKLKRIAEIRFGLDVSVLIRAIEDDPRFPDLETWLGVWDEVGKNHGIKGGTHE